MKFANVAKFFDRDPIHDGYSDVFLFNAQFASYDSSNPDGTFQRRRTLSLAPSVVVPPHRVVSCYSQRWVVGDLAPDGFYSKPVRYTASSKLATDLFEVLTPGQACSRATSSSNLYSHVDHLKDTVNSNADSEYDPQYEASFARGSAVLKGYFLKSSGRYLYVRSCRLDASGFVVATADEIRSSLGGAWDTNCEVTATFAGPINPITELPGAGTTTSGILLDMYKLYSYATDADELNRRGDRTLLIASMNPKPAAGQRVTINGTRWQILTCQPFMDAWCIHLKRA